MNYEFSNSVRDNNKLRNSFNELTRKTYGFDFEDWYKAGHWGDLYIPHVLLDGERVVSNISVSLMQFDVDGITKNYIQIGTVMTDPLYRNQGLNRRLMEWVLNEYQGKADGIYLFANDSVLDYYPKFGFRTSKEYEYYLPCDPVEERKPYLIQNVTMTCPEQRDQFYKSILPNLNDSAVANQNDGMCMCQNLGLYQFYMGMGFDDTIYYVPEADVYLSASMDETVLRIHQIFSKQRIDIRRLANTLGAAAAEVVLEYTPANRDDFLVREYAEEDTTLFILGDDLQCIDREKLRFPVFSHT